MWHVWNGLVTLQMLGKAGARDNSSMHVDTMGETCAMHKATPAAS